MVWNAEQYIQLRPAEGTSGESSICVPTSVGCFIGDKMKRIPLTQGKFAIVDDEDFEELSKYKWRLSKRRITCYAITSIYKASKQTTELMHRIIMKPKDGQWTDHRDGNGLNNIKSNLRLCTSSQNAQNRRALKNTTSKYKGVMWHPRLKKWKAQIYSSVKCIYLGVFADEVEAAKTYDKKAKELFGEFAKFNFNGE